MNEQQRNANQIHSTAATTKKIHTDFFAVYGRKFVSLFLDNMWNGINAIYNLYFFKTLFTNHFLHLLPELR